MPLLPYGIEANVEISMSCSCQNTVKILSPELVPGRIAPFALLRMRIAVAWFVMVFCSVAWVGAVDVEMHDKGRSFTIQAPHLAIGPLDFAAKIKIDGVEHELVSTAGQALGAQVLRAQPGPYGPVEAVVSKVRFEKLGIDLTMRIERPEGVPCVLLNAAITNRGAEKVELLELTPLKSSPGSHAMWDTEALSKDWIATGLGTAPLENKKFFLVQTLADLKKGTRFYDDCAVYKRDGVGFFIGPVGSPAAYIETVFGEGFSSRSTMVGVLLRTGESSWGQQVGLFFEAPNRAVRRWADWVAKTHGARTSTGALGGWINSTSGFKPSAQNLIDIVKFAEASQGRLRPQAIVLDRGTDAPVPLQKTRAFPEDLSSYASLIEEAGARPGLRLTLDERVSALAENKKFIGQATGLGFQMLKMVYQMEATPEESRLTDFMEQRRLAADIRAAAGDATYLLSTWTSIKRAAVGTFDANRSAPNADRGGLRPVIEEALWAFPLNRRWYAVDNDVCYLATDLADVDPLVGGWPMARTWLSMVGLSCGAAFTGDLWFLPKFAPYLRNFEVLQPPAAEETEVLDLGTATEWPRLAGRVVRPWGEWTVALLWNPGKKEQKIPIDLARIGAQPGSRYAVWSFWQNTYLGVVKGSYASSFLAPSASEHLVFTPLPEEPNKPILIGSNFHIYCGAAELKSVAALNSGMAIEFTDAGALDGSLFVYSRIKPVMDSATGCEVSDIRAAGENAWQIDIRDRRLGELQRVELSLPLPPHRQGWFWALLGLLAASTVFGIRKYFVGQRSQRAVAQIRLLQEERARIARDLHDELGASLAQISMLGDRIEHSGEAAEGVIQRIQKNSKESLRRLNEIVWAVNPERDSLEHLATYLCKFAQDFLADSGIRFRSEIPDELPPCHLTSRLRHNLYLATREAFHNAVRHGQPTGIFLRISVGADELRIAIEDNGSGFDAVKTGSSGHGLANMRTRMESIGGGFTISSHPGRGCTIVLTLPLHAKNQS